jgi:TPR repeat protein
VASGVSAQDRVSPAQERAFQEATAALKLGNYALAMDQFRALAEAGHLASQYNLGWMRAQGLGGRVDFIAAYQWFGLVAKAGQEKAVQALDQLRSRMTAAEIAEGEARIAAWRATTP